MTYKLKYLAAIAILIVTLLAPGKSPLASPRGNFLLVGPSIAQIFDTDRKLYGLAEFRSYHKDRSFGRLVCLETTGDVAYFGFGFFDDIRIIDNVYGVFSFSPGIVSKNGEKKLGHVVEFRTSFELFYQFPKNYRAGVSLNHYSNGGLGDTNPGTESLKMMLYIPVL